MNVKVEKTENNNEVKLEFTVEAEKFDGAIKTVFNKNSKYFNIPGFRKGKAPRKVIEQNYGDMVFFDDAFDEVISNEYSKFLSAINPSYLIYIILILPAMSISHVNISKLINKK